MTEVIIGENDDFEEALKLFNKKVQQDRILVAYRRHEYYEPPSVKRKKKEAAKLRKSIRSTLRNSRY